MGSSFSFCLLGGVYGFLFSSKTGAVQFDVNEQYRID